MKSFSDILKKFARLLECPDCHHRGNVEADPEKQNIQCPKCDQRMCDAIIVAKAEDLKGFVSNIEEDTVGNSNFRKVVYTGKNTQLVLMSLKPGENIGMETHSDVDQFFRFEKGSGVATINGKKHRIKDGSAIIIPQGAKHDIVADERGLKLYSLYSPPHHKDGTIHKTKEKAEASDEHFDGETTE